MKKTYNEVIKFKILTDIKDNPELYAGMIMPEIVQHIIKKFDTAISTDSLYRWAKIYGFAFKTQKKTKAPNQTEAIKQTNQRIRILGMVIRNMCKELNLQSPSMLDKLLDGIAAQYKTDLGFNSETTVLEKQIYDEI